MKQKSLLTKIALLLVMLVGAGNASADKTYILTKVTSVEAGNFYVFEQDGYVMKNTINSSKALQTTKNYKTTGLTGTEAYIWKLESASGGFYMKNVSLSSSQYLNNTTSGTDVSFGDKNSIWKFTFTYGVALIQNTSNSNRFLGNATQSGGGNYTYKAYATGNLKSYEHDITVYKLIEDNRPTTEVSIGSAGMATFSSSNTLDFSDITTIAAYYATVNDGKVTFTRIYKVPANTGLLLRNAAGEGNGEVAANVPVLVTASEAESTTGNAMVSVAEDIEQLASTSGGYHNYILNNHSTYGLGFFKAANKKVAAGRAYLRIAETEEAREFIGFSDEEPTSMDAVPANHGRVSSEVYDLQGRRVVQPAKGLYILNGKKVLVK